MISCNINSSKCVSLSTHMNEELIGEKKIKQIMDQATRLFSNKGSNKIPETQETESGTGDSDEHSTLH